MMYQSEGVARCCIACKGAILKDQWMLDLFRANASRPVVWIHGDCVRKVIENYILRKEQREATSAGVGILGPG